MSKTSDASADACPVDHKAREAWLKAAETPADACPVDHKTREAWLKANRSSIETFPDAPAKASQAAKGTSCDSSHIDQATPSPAAAAPKGLFASWFSSSPVAVPAEQDGLGTYREVSTIPRASPVDGGAQPANSEKEGGTSTSGNWIYPSEKMFFEAMKRKGFSSEAKEMKAVVPLHNAVNERAWKEIKDWEKPYGAAAQCGGPKLHSFEGLSGTLSPRARINNLLGYNLPFDRHDWRVDRCGQRIDYIIDFYQGRDEGKGKINFYLDVRPKLNSWEGVKMRASKALGLV